MTVAGLDKSIILFHWNWLTTYVVNMSKCILLNRFHFLFQSCSSLLCCLSFNVVSFWRCPNIVFGKVHNGKYILIHEVHLSFIHKKMTRFHNSNFCFKIVWKNFGSNTNPSSYKLNSGQSLTTCSGKVNRIMRWFKKYIALIWNIPTTKSTRT